MKKLILLSLIFLFSNFIIAEGRKTRKCPPSEQLVGQTCKDDQEAINKCNEKTPLNAYFCQSGSKCINNIPYCSYVYDRLLPQY